MEYVIGQSDESTVAAHIEKLLRGMCVAGFFDIDVYHNTAIDETRRRYVFGGADAEAFMELIHDFHNGDIDETDGVDEIYELVLCAAVSADDVTLQDDGTIAIVYDMEFCPHLEVYRNCTEEEVVAEFECMIKEFGFKTNSHPDVVYNLEAAKDLDEIMVSEWFSSWVDGKISDGDYPAEAANYSC